MHYLITGHTGFKGSWLSLMLQMQGHIVSGISLHPPRKSLFTQAELAGTFKYDFRIDIRMKEELTNAIYKINPDIIVHLAAQPLVLDSYKFPIETFETNVIGTLNVLEAAKKLENLQAALIITTDKVYKNLNHLRGYVETDELGGDDPYSASKAAADIAAQSWIKSFASAPMSIARAGNVIGGGDWGKDRLISDLINAYSSGQIPALRYPDAIRPWQHVLDCLSGYLKLIDFMIKNKTGGEWNFGPNLDDKFTVADLTNRVAQHFEIKGKKWTLADGIHPHESNYLLLNSTKAHKELNWRDKYSFDESISSTIDWYKRAQYSNHYELTLEQVKRYLTI
jgi:CDP-glucose 4,6-dehydratase